MKFLFKEGAEYEKSTYNIIVYKALKVNADGTYTSIDSDDNFKIGELTSHELHQITQLSEYGYVKALVNDGIVCYSNVYETVQKMFLQDGYKDFVIAKCLIPSGTNFAKQNDHFMSEGLIVEKILNDFEVRDHADDFEGNIGDTVVSCYFMGKIIEINEYCGIHQIKHDESIVSPGQDIMVVGEDAEFEGVFLREYLKLKRLKNIL